MSATLLGTLTIGQAPRADITPILLEHLPAGVECVHMGVLDGLDRDTIARYFPVAPGEAVLTTRLLDGGAVILGKNAVRAAVIDKLGRLEARGCSIIALLCTGEFHGLSCDRAWLVEPDLLVPPVLTALSGPRRAGILVPLAEQMTSEGAKWRSLQQPPCYAAASPYNSTEQQLGAAALELKAQRAEVIVMDCMGYTEQHRRIVHEATGLPVILSNALLARLLAALV
ncbi:AroM family protein [Sodalis sp. RH21]|uniref:AroM family protein n=1 Tax=unclassified Sodalis (in: enterobacteria) TaxID=2636512 RepID=UPI0039B3B7CE